MSSHGEANDSHQKEPAGLSLDAFRAELDVFSGPLDLLLYLVKREEVDIFEIPVSRITDQYLSMLRTMQVFDTNTAAEFVVMAATLMELKSRTLLPELHGQEEDDEADEARDELVRQLLRYKLFREAADRLDEMAAAQALRFSRPPHSFETERLDVEPDVLLEEVEVWDLLSAFGAVISQTQMERVRDILYDDVPIADYVVEVLRRLEATGTEMGFLDFFSGDRSRSRVIGVFLAVLELVRLGKVSLYHDGGADGEIRIAPKGGPPAPAQ